MYNSEMLSMKKRAFQLQWNMVSDEHILWVLHPGDAQQISNPFSFIYFFIIFKIFLLFLFLFFPSLLNKEGECGESQRCMESGPHFFPPKQ